MQSSSKSEGLVEVTVSLPESVYAILERLSSGDAAKMSLLLAHAVRLYGILHEAQQSKSRVLIRRPSGDEQQLSILA